MSNLSEVESPFVTHLEKYEELANVWLWYPDLALDLLSPKEGGIKLHSDQRIFMRCGARFFNEYGCFPRGWGKCVVGNTLLYTSDGLKEIGSYFNYQNDDVETEYGLDLNVVNRNGAKAHSGYGIYSGFKPTKKITTQEGYDLEGTFLHPILVMFDDGTIDFKKLADVKVGDRVVISRENNLFGNSVDINHEADMMDWVASIPKRKRRTLNVRDIPSSLTSDLAYLFGLIVGGRYSSQNGAVTFSSDNTAAVSNYQQMMSQYFDVAPSVNSEHECAIQDQFLIKYFETCGLLQFEHHTKQVPECILGAPKDIQASFIAGLYAVNCTFEEDSLAYYSGAKKFAKQIQLILLNFGIIASLCLNDLDCEAKKYCLSVRGHDKKLFVSEIVYAARTTETQKASAEESGFKSKRGYYLAEVVSVQNRMNHVYDLNVPDTNSFVSNGFVSHNTFCEVATMIITAIRFPNIEIGLTAQTKENAASLLKDKYNELIRYYPMIQNEVTKVGFSKGDAEIRLKNGAIIDALANAQSSKGQRRKRLNIEESNLMDNVTYEDVLEPVVEVGRITAGKLAITNPEELNQQINFFTTPGFRGSDEYRRSLKMISDMRDLRGKIVLGSDWMLGCWYGRGSSKSAILKKKEDSSPIAFDMNYGGNWVGSATGALVNINRLMACRTLTEPILLSTSESDEYCIGVDVARSQNKSNNQSSIAVGKVVRGDSGKIEEVQLVNIIHVSNMLNFSTQACIVKRVKKRYNAKMVIVDGNGLGVGLIDELMKETFDPTSGETYPAWDTVNTTALPETSRSERCLYDLKAQSDQTRILSNFIDMVDSGKLRVLESRNGGDYSIKSDDDINSRVMPFVQSELFFQEVGNLKLLQNGKNLSVERVVRKFDKDRFSAVAYLLYYIAKVDDSSNENSTFDAEAYAQRLKKLNHKPKMY